MRYNKDESGWLHNAKFEAFSQKQQDNFVKRLIDVLPFYTPDSVVRKALKETSFEFESESFDNSNTGYPAINIIDLLDFKKLVSKLK